MRVIIPSLQALVATVSIVVMLPTGSLALAVDRTDKNTQEIVARNLFDDFAAMTQGHGHAFGSPSDGEVPDGWVSSLGNSESDRQIKALVTDTMDKIDEQMRAERHGDFSHYHEESAPPFPFNLLQHHDDSEHEDVEGGITGLLRRVRGQMHFFNNPGPRPVFRPVVVGSGWSVQRLTPPPAETADSRYLRLPSQRNMRPLYRPEYMGASQGPFPDSGPRTQPGSSGITRGAVIKSLRTVVRVVYQPFNRRIRITLI